MKKTKISFTAYFVALSMIVGFLAGFFCDVKKGKNDVVYVPAHEYQFDVEQDSVVIFDDKRLVGYVPYDSSAFNKLILNDNQ